MQYLVHHMLRDSARRFADEIAVVEGKQQLTYAELANAVNLLSRSLVNLGLQRGDRVAIQLAPSIPLVQSILATSAAGGVFVPIHHGLFPDQVQHILSDCGARFLITDSHRFSRYRDGRENVSVESVIIEDACENIQADRASTNVVQWNDLFDGRVVDAQATQGSYTESPSEVCIETDLAAILYTSGSTGKPKGVMLSHKNILAGAEIVSDYLGIKQTDRLLCALPLSFDAGLNQLTTALLQGASVVMLDFKFGRDIVKALQTHQVTGLAGVPSLWQLLAQPSSGLAKQDLQHLRYITNTGGAMAKKLLDDLRILLPRVDVVLMYGLTEAFRSTYLPPRFLDAHPDSMGIPIPNTEILVVGEDGHLCEPGEVGELVHRGPTVSMGYWKQPEKTNQVLRPHPFPKSNSESNELVCYSGDLVRRDEEGFLYFVGRRDNQIKSSGFRISPTEVEDVLCSLPNIEQAAIVGAPDELLGQHLVAFVIAQREIALPQLQADCASRLPRHMIPKRMIQVARFPLTASGKVDYPALRKQLEPIGSETGNQT